MLLQTMWLQLSNPSNNVQSKSLSVWYHDLSSCNPTDVVVQYSYKFAAVVGCQAWEMPPEWGSEELPWCYCEHQLQSTSTVSPLCKTKWKPEAIEKAEVLVFFPNCLIQGFRSGWSRWFMRCAHVYKSCNPEAGGGKSNPPQSWGTLVSPFWMKKLEVGKPVVPHVEFCLFGSACLIHNLSVAH